MQVNRIGNGLNNQVGFKGVQNEMDDTGRIVQRFYLDKNVGEDCYYEFTRQIPDKNAYMGYRPDNNGWIRVKIGPNGTVVDPRALLGIDKSVPYSMRIRRGDRTFPDTGIQQRIDGQRPDNGRDNQHGECNFIPAEGTTPLRYGNGTLIFWDSMPAGFSLKDKSVRYSNDLVFDKEKEIETEKAPRTFSDNHGVTSAGFSAVVPVIDEQGSESVVLTPFGNPLDPSNHGYWTSGTIDIDEFRRVFKDAFHHGKNVTYDHAITSQGWTGIEMQYLLLHPEQRPDEFYHFNIVSNQITIGIIPKNGNVGVKTTNYPFSLVQDADGTIRLVEEKYDEYRPSSMQWYDKRFVTEEQLADKTTPIKAYGKLRTRDILANNTYQDSVVLQEFRTPSPEILKANVRRVNEYNKAHPEKPILLDSVEGLTEIWQTPEYKFGQITEGINIWDAMNHLPKKNYVMTATTENKLNALPTVSERECERARYVSGMNQNVYVGAKSYGATAALHRNMGIRDTLQGIKGKNVSSAEEINKLAENGEINHNIRFTEGAFENVLLGLCEQLEDTGIYEKDELTTKSLMDFQLQWLPFDVLLLGQLNSSYLSCRPSDESYLEKSRFDLMEDGNPHIDAEHRATYTKMNSFFSKQIREFADAIIKKLNYQAAELLLDEDGQYTELGEYVIKEYGFDIARYAFTKALAGDLFQPDENGNIVYDREILQNVSLESLGIKPSTYKQEAEAINDRIERGLRKLTEDDIDLVANSILYEIKDATATDFRLATAGYYRSGNTMDGRIDAEKDEGDMDSVRAGETSFDDGWDGRMKVSKAIVREGKAVNSASKVVAEITNEYEVKERTGSTKYTDGVEAKNVLQNETGIHSETGYSYTYKLPMNIYGIDPDNGETTSSIGALTGMMQNLFSTRSVDTIRGMMSVVENQDKPNIIHTYAIDMTLYQNQNNIKSFNEKGWYLGGKDRHHRKTALELLSASDNYSSMPMELKFNVDNPDYLMASSVKALGMGKLIKESVCDVPNLTAEQKTYLLRAIADMSEGRFLEFGTPTNRQALNIPALTSLDGALNEIIGNTDIPQSTKEYLLKAIPEVFEKHIDENLVVGDFSWNENIEKVNNLLEKPISKEEAKKYELYTVCLARAIKYSLEEKEPNPEIRNKVYSSLRAFIEKYNADMVKPSKSQLTMSDNVQNAERKEGFGHMSIEKAIAYVFEHAQYLAEKEGKGECLNNITDIICNTYRNAVEPAMQKAIYLMALGQVLPGEFVSYFGAMLGKDCGGELAKNIHLAGRDAVPVYLSFVDGINKEFKSKIYDMMLDAKVTGNRKGLEALKNGTPYMAYTHGGEAAAYAMVSPTDIVIPIVHSKGIFHEARHDYSQTASEEAKKRARETAGASVNPDNKYVPILETQVLDHIELDERIQLPDGTEFRNSDPTDKEVYVSHIENGKTVIRKKPSVWGSDIVLNQDTAKNGVMILTTAAVALSAAAMFRRGVGGKAALEKMIKTIH